MLARLHVHQQKHLGSLCTTVSSHMQPLPVSRKDACRRDLTAQQYNDSSPHTQYDHICISHAWGKSHLNQDF